jgi:hypothetical protein
MRKWSPYFFFGAVPFWIWSFLDMYLFRARSTKWTIPYSPGLWVDGALTTAVILTACGGIGLWIDFMKRHRP